MTTTKFSGSGNTLIWLTIIVVVGLMVCVIGGLAWALFWPEGKGEATAQPAVVMPATPSATPTSPSASPTSATATPAAGGTPRPAGAQPAPAQPSPPTASPAAPPLPTIPAEVIGVLDPLEGDIYAERQLLLKFKAAAGRAAFLQAHGLSKMDEIAPLDVWRVSTGGRSASAALRELYGDPQLEYAAYNFYGSFFREPGDPRYGQQWNMPIIHAPQGWDVNTGGPVIVAVVDSGLDLGHPDLAGKLVTGYDFGAADADPSDTFGHGTHVAGIAAAQGDNGEGVAGVSWGAQIMPIKVCPDNSGRVTIYAVAAGVVWATDHGARVINLSLGLDLLPILTEAVAMDLTQILQEATDYAHQHNALVVASAGNEYQEGNLPPYPAAYPHVMAVGATGSQDQHAYYSNAGTYVDVSAPGGEMEATHDPNGVLSTMPTYPVYLTTEAGFTTGYDTMAGTSMAAPHVAGLAALIWSVAPQLSNDQVAAIIEGSADDLGPPGWDGCFGTGRINVQRALQMAAAGQVPGPARDHGLVAAPAFCPDFTIPLTPFPLPTVGIEIPTVEFAVPTVSLP